METRPMRSLLETSEIFEASSKLQAAATALAAISERAAIRDADRENLKWCGNFLQEVDWSTHTPGAAAGCGNLAVQATEVRPSFYATLLNARRLFLDAGVRENEIQAFLAKTYEFLSSAETMNGCDVRQLKLAAIFLDKVAADLLMRLTANGVPLERDMPPLIPA